MVANGACASGPGALVFRQAAAPDVAAIVALVNSAYRGDSSRVGWTTEADLLDGQRTDAGEIASLIAAPGSMILLCLNGPELIGSVHLQQAPEGAYLGMFTVRPSLQGRGIGRRFLAAAERLAREEWGVARALMTVITRRQELIAYYERRGYRRTGRLKDFPSDPRFGIPRVAGLQLEVLEKTLPVV
jgi:ribosomal protein S18 acetylase RimI-like enzyme